MNAKQQKFVDGVLAGKSATRAYIDAGYTARGHSAETNAGRLLKNAEVAAIVSAFREKAAEKVARDMELTAERTLREVARLAYADPRKLYHPDGTAKQPHEWDDDTAAIVAALDVVEESNLAGQVVSRTKKLKTWDKRAALELAAKLQGLIRDKLEVSGPDGGPLEVREVVVSTREEAAAVVAAQPAAG